MIQLDIGRRLVVVGDRSTFPQIKMAWKHTQAHPKTGAAVLPFHVHSSMLLREFGLQVPSPVNYYYDWPGRFIPLEHQKVTTAFLTINKRAFCVNDMGTGKTLSMYWAADYLMREDLVRRALVIAPLSTLENVHAQTIFTHFYGDNRRTFAVLHGSPHKRRELLAEKHDFYIINHDGVEVIADELAKRDDIDLVCLDELATLRNASTNRWKITKSIIKAPQWVWGFTGTPIPNEPTDAYAQVKLVKPENLHLYPSFRSFKSATMQQINQFKWRPLPNALTTVMRVMSPSIRYSRDECLDLPETTYQTLSVEMSAEQKTAYKQLERTTIAEVNGRKITAVNEAVKIMRLVQVASGVVYDVKGVHQRMDAKPRFAVLKEIISEAPAKVIVYVPFVGNLQHIEDEIGKYFTCVQVYGETPARERNEIFKAFQSSQRDPRVLIAHPKCMSHGLTLVQAATIVWWAPTTSNETYDQANARITRQGQTLRTQIIHLTATATEREAFKRLELKQNMQGLLNRLVESQGRL